MSMRVVIRRYRDEDRERYRALWKELTEWHREIYRDPTIGGEHPEDHFDRHLAEVGHDQLWVAVYASQVVGLVGLILRGKEAEIEPLIVSKAYRRRGIGRRLIETVVAEAREREVRFLNIKPVARNTETIRFLYEQGFRNLGHIELFMDFSNYVWKTGLELFGCRFDY